MKQASVIKTLGTADITDEQMEKINTYTRRALARDEVFVFSLILCDNEIDRDGERFPTQSLQTLRELFLGKTGLFDHKPVAAGQSARVFETQVEETGEKNSVGEAYTHLRAWAYMVRCDKTADLILEIDAGIKKEVSVGCAVAEVGCSICGAKQRGMPTCTHKKGHVYSGRLCHHLLLEPTDAYEWSFVAVPAQRKAGVVKRLGFASQAAQTETETVDKAHLCHLERLAELGGRYEADLRGDVVRLGLLSQPDLDAATLEEITEKLSVPELEALQKSFGAAASKRYPITPQLAQGKPKNSAQFRV